MKNTYYVLEGPLNDDELISAERKKIANKSFM